MLLNQIVSLESSIGVALVTPEMRACTFLYENGASSSSNLQAAVRASPAGFQGIKRRLLKLGVICSEKCPTDARVTLYDLTFTVRRALDVRLAGRALPMHEISNYQEALAVS